MKKILALLTAMMLLVSACSSATVDGAGKELEDAITNVTDADNKYVQMVKGGYRSDDPDTTYEEAFTAFFGAPRWKYFESDDGKDVVEFTGDCTYRDAPVKARIQFVVDEEGGTFEATYLAFNEVPQDALTLSAVIAKAFEKNETLPAPTTKAADTPVTVPAKGPATLDDAMEIFERWEATHPLDPNFTVRPGYDDAENDAFTLFLWGYEAELGTIYVDKTDGSMKIVSDFVEYDLDDWYGGSTPAAGGYVGSWGDRCSQRCYMDIESYDGISYNIDINWSSSAQENTHWSFSGTYDEGEGGIHYYGSKIEEYYPDNGEMQETYAYSDGEGLIWIGDDGLLYWNDYTENAGSDCEFEKIQ